MMEVHFHCPYFFMSWCSIKAQRKLNFFPTLEGRLSRAAYWPSLQERYEMFHTYALHPLHLMTAFRRPYCH
jgi:hypothetical protein